MPRLCTLCTRDLRSVRTCDAPTRHDRSLRIFVPKQCRGLTPGLLAGVAHAGGKQRLMLVGDSDPFSGAHAALQDWHPRLVFQENTTRSLRKLDCYLHACCASSNESHDNLLHRFGLHHVRRRAGQYSLKSIGDDQLPLAPHRRGLRATGRPSSFVVALWRIRLAHVPVPQWDLAPSHPLWTMALLIRHLSLFPSVHFAPHAAAHTG